jgi:hypothetical protein
MHQSLSSIVEKSIEPLPEGDSAPVPEISKSPLQPSTDPVLDFNYTRSPSIHSHVSSPLPSVEEEPVALDAALARASPSSEQPTLTCTRLNSSLKAPHLSSPRKKKTRPAPSPKASLSPPLTSPPLRRSASAVEGNETHLLAVQVVRTAVFLQPRPSRAKTSAGGSTYRPPWRP